MEGSRGNCQVFEPQLFPMDTLLVILSYVLIFCSIVFVLLFGESSFFRDGVVGKLHRVLTQGFPVALQYARDARYAKTN